VTRRAGDSAPEPTSPPGRRGAESIHQAGALTGEALGAVVDVVAEVHGAISGRVQTLLPPGARQVNHIHRTVADGVYRLVATAHRSVPGLATEIAAHAGRPNVAESVAGRTVLPILSGFWGDRIAASYPDLGIPTAVRHRQRDVPLEPAAVREVFAPASSHLVLFVHGLAGSEMAWWRQVGAERDGAPPRSYGDRLTSAMDVTPVYVRYNSGQHISQNGMELSRLLEQLVEVWPVDVEQVSVVGHSMGGLVARSASSHATEHRYAWARLLRRVVTLGSPHGGAPLEQGVNVADWVLTQFPETRPFARVLRSRSPGIKDLRFGSVQEQDWFGHDPDEFLRDRRTEAPLLPTVTYAFVAATLTRDPEHPAGRLVGDGLVRLSSAAGAAHRRLRLDLDRDLSLGGTGHLALLNHPRLDPALREWLGNSAAAC
jgi:pimeloyl-ACP methyl ester carboxylesterase